jgi:glycosyltransferase involved in cell wall biosynthesis
MVKELGLEEAVGFLGTVPRDVDVRREYFGADVFCLPSLQEGFGIVFLEAMAAGLPIVASTSAAIPEVAPDGEVAILVPPLDAEALAGAIIRLLKDPVLRARLGAIGQERVRGYDFPAVAQKCLAAALKGEERNIHACR